MALVGWIVTIRRPGLTIEGTDTVMFLGMFSRKAVEQACVARGWRFR
jgi:hypothetical protein